MIDLGQIPEPIRKVALTGSIGTGKSTAAREFRALGVEVIDADELARAAVRPGEPALEEVAQAFGRELITSDGALDRAKLAAIVFCDQGARKKLEAIIHPRVATGAERLFDAALAADPNGYAVYDIPLLFELGLEKEYDLVVTVYAAREEQARRVALRSGLTPTEIESRIAVQIDAGEKARRSHVVLDNSGSPEELARQVALLARAIRRHNEEKMLTTRWIG